MNQFISYFFVIIILLYKWEHSAYSISISSNNILLQLNLHPSFLESTYHCENEEFLVRQVPGDGGCLFHSLAVCLSHIFNSNFHFCDFDSKTRQLSDKLRQLSVDVLSSNNVTLHMESENYVMSNVLLELVAYHYNSTTQEYLEKMRLAHTWGGGPEIVCLSNALKRPIFVYELDCIGGLFRKKCFQLKVNTKFGIPDYEKKEPLHILCADGRFPNIKPGRHKKQGDHFLALFPVSKLIIGNNKELDQNNLKRFSVDEIMKIEMSAAA